MNAGYLDIERLNNQVADYLQLTDLNQRWRGVCLVQDKIKGEVGDVIEHCKDLMEAFMQSTYFDLKQFKSDSDGALVDNINSDDCVLCDCIYLIGNYFHNILSVERVCTTKEQLDGLCNELRSIRDEGFEITDYRYWFVHYYYWHNAPVYKLCKQIYEFLVSILNIERIEEFFFKQVAELVFLYIALQTEKEKIKDEAVVQGVQLTETATDTPNLPTEAIKPSERATTPKQGKTASQPTETVKERFLSELDCLQEERIAKYFQRAIDKGYMCEVDDGYKWRNGRTQPTQCAYFLYEVLKPDGYDGCIFPLKAVSELFGINAKSLENLNRQARAHSHCKWMEQMDIDIFFD